MEFEPEKWHNEYYYQTSHTWVRRTQLLQLIAPKRLERQKWAWFHSKELRKSFQNLMYFIQIDSEIKTQCIVKVQKKSFFVQTEPIVFISL